MEEDPRSESWTTVDRKASKKRASKTDPDGPGEGWNTVTKDRRRKDSGGVRHDRNNERRGDRRGDRGKPPSRGGSTQRNTLPRKQSQRDAGAGWTSQRSSPSPGSFQSAQVTTADTRPSKVGAIDSTAKSLESESVNRKPSWAKLVSHPDTTRTTTTTGKSTPTLPFPVSTTLPEKNAPLESAPVSTEIVSEQEKVQSLVLSPAAEDDTSNPPPVTNTTEKLAGCESLQTMPDIIQVPSEESKSEIIENIETPLPSNPLEPAKDERMFVEGESYSDKTCPDDISLSQLNVVETKICSIGLMLNIDSNIEPENSPEDSNDNVDTNGNNVVLDKNKNETASDKIESNSEQIGTINSETRHYNRDLLLQLQKHPLSLQKPDKLPQLEIVLDSPMRSSSSAPTLGEAPSQYVHTFARGGMPTKRDSRRKEVKKIISLSREPVKLHKADNAWTPGSKAPDDKESELNVLLKKVRAILNKLTPQKFSTLVVQFKELDIDSEEKLVSCMELVFEKALDEPVFSQAYANMCKELFLKNVVKQNSTELVDFRMLLLRRCQTEFEKDYLSDEERKAYTDKMAATESEEEVKKIKEEFQQLELKLRRRSLGNIRFIGELYKLQLIRGRILHGIVQKLLLAVDEESMECLCRLLSTCGSDLEAEIKTIHEKTRHLYQLDTFFDKMQEIIEQRKTSSRIRFLLQDVIDLRKKNWVSRHKEAGPKTIEQIHKEAKLEALRIEIDDQKGDPPIGRRSEERNRRKTDFRPRQVNEEGTWNNVPNKAAKLSDVVDPERLRMKKVDPDSLKLGPSMGRGFTSTGATPIKQQETIKSFNLFQMLDAEPAEQNNVKYSGRASEPVRGTYDRSLSRGRSPRTPSKENTKETRSVLKTNAGDELDSSPRSKLKGDIAADQDELRHQYKTILEEYINNCDFKETLSSVCEMFHPETMKILVEETFNVGLEKSLKDQECCGVLLAALMEEQCLSPEQICVGLGVLLEIADDIIIDIPKFWELTGRILAVVLIKGSCWGVVVENCCSYIPTDTMRQHFIYSLLYTVKQTNEELFIQITVQYKESLEILLSQNFDKFLSDKNLTSSKSDPPPRKVDEVLLNGNLQEDLYRKILAVFSQQQTANDELSKIDDILSDIVMDNVTVRTLVTAVIESAVKGIGGPSVHCTLDNRILTERISVLKKYIDAKKDRELNALYAIQHLVNKLEHPNKLLHNILEELYDKECISEEGLFDWERSDNPEEQEGKGVALKSCNQFFNWLRTADEEDDDQVAEGGSLSEVNEFTKNKDQ